MSAKSLDDDEPSAPASALRAQIDAPIFNPIIKAWVGKGELDYEVYLRTTELLSLQSQAEELSIPEELMFQIVHQSQELWLKLLSHEGAHVVAAIDATDLWTARSRLDRMLRVQRCLGDEIGVLASLTPDEFQSIRRNLGNGSGQESPGYNALRAVAAGIEAALDRLLERRQLTLVGLYRRRSEAADVCTICEQLVDLDESFQLWLTRHFLLVRRTIGIDKSVQGLDGYPTTMLPGRMTQPLFRALWSARVELTNEWKREGGHAPGQRRISQTLPTADRIK